MEDIRGKNCFIWKKNIFCHSNQATQNWPAGQFYNIGQVRVHLVHWNLVECNEIDTERLFEGFTFISNSYTHMKIIIWKRDSIPKYFMILVSDMP